MASPTIHKVVRILRFIVDEGSYQSIREMSSMLKIPRSTLHRIYRALVKEGILEFDPKTKQSRWGPELIYIARSVYQSIEIRRLALPILQKIVHELNETTQLVLYDPIRHQIIFTDELPCNQPIRYHAPIGIHLPIHAGASGKVIMAFLPEEEIQSIISSGLKRLTNRTIISPNRLRISLAEIREKGYAITNGERTPETVGIACPIFNSAASIVGGLVVTIPAYRYRPELKALAYRLVKEGGERLSRMLGLPPDNSYPPLQKGNVERQKKNKKRNIGTAERPIKEKEGT